MTLEWKFEARMRLLLMTRSKQSEESSQKSQRFVDYGCKKANTEAFDLSDAGSNALRLRLPGMLVRWDRQCSAPRTNLGNMLMRLGEPGRPCGNESINTCLPSPGYHCSLNTSMMSQERAATYHPAFNAPDADAILSSLDNTLYRLPSPVLRRTTIFFASPSFTFEPPSKSIPIHEHDPVLERLLRILSGLAIPPWCTFDDLEGVLGLAETWGAWGAVDVAIAARFGWAEKAEHEEQHQEALHRIPTRALVKLFKFHRKRRDAFRAGMAGESAERRCGGCGEAVGEEAWAALLWRMFWEMDAQPSGEGLCSLEVEEWDEMQRCLGEQCAVCGRAAYERLEVLERVRKCLDGLPDTV
ncbi:hypothetical protein IW261DRAFT_1426467 [Armillaria novae-zelandiae]|uniref:Uncharacterized protein n=1 Tax=Armillaria novae-zelandiae TaxID=153914 RepID=A0AA39NL21_9AGAR|nr:hypothetical protein IW261DRAFT_1426467 [Armillaria novae-zelandiae]